MVDPAQLRAAYEKAKADLLAQRTDDRHWEGQLSSSALSTATAISALAIAAGNVDGQAESQSAADSQRIDRGIRWLLAHQNADGGWGDTDKSHSNISTTMLVNAALHLAGRAEELAEQLSRSSAYVQRNGGIAGVRERYGKDKTFAVPILTNCALAGLVDWSEVPPLPFELACLPQRLYHLLQLPVVSYAIPALVAIGQARFLARPPRLPWIRFARRHSIGPSLRVLQRMQPTSGGYLEAVPLTSFVTMSLAATQRIDHPVTRNGLAFIRDSARSDGSWPIDTNLATWSTTLAINALATAEKDVFGQVNLDWLLSCQHGQPHPFTGAAAGGWGWTDLSGAVPDADDTAGALLALRRLSDSPDCETGARETMKAAAARGVTWLLDLQNRDGGWPTFCRGWGRLPFDRSGADLTAHALRGLDCWRDQLPPSTARRIDRAVRRGWQYLRQQQRSDGSWIPLWFGHQDHPREENPVFGTTRVLRAYQELGQNETPAAVRGYEYLESVQRADGGWSGAGGRPHARADQSPSSVEETALAVEALLGGRPSLTRENAVVGGLQWLVEAVLSDRHKQTTPIGFYFAKLWYHERLYPLVFTVAALGQAVRRWVHPNQHSMTGSSVTAGQPDIAPPRHNSKKTT